MMTSDKNQPSVFRPRARVIQALGSDLISSESVALSELVKNSYDADATRVLVRIDAPGDAIEVTDNGHGMSLDTLRTVWLQPATPSKLEESRSPKQRRMLGAKGIGRFAAARLGSSLDVASRLEGAPDEAWATFDWSLFENPATFLDEITIPSGSRVPEVIVPETLRQLLGAPKHAGPGGEGVHGTRLKVSNLKQTWSPSAVQTVRRALSRLVAPGADASDFAIRLDVIGDEDETSEYVEPPSLLKYPHYRVEGNVGADGTYHIDYTVSAAAKKNATTGRFARKTTAPFELLAGDPSRYPRDRRRLQCGPLRFDIRVWDRDDLGNVVQRTGSTLRSVREDLDAIAGVSIYRDGFRVLPYGEPNNDWLRLDIRRVQKPTMRLSNNQIHGYIGISADDNPALKDQSNREGLFDGEALQDLREVILHVLTELEALRYSSRPRRGPSGADSTKTLFGALNLDTLREQLGVSAEQPLIQQALATADLQLAEGIKNVQQVLGRYHRLATLGQLIDVVLHDGRQPIASIINQADLGVEAAGRANVDPKKELAPRFLTIRTQAQHLSAMFKRIEPFGGRRRGRPKQLYLEDIVKSAFELFEHDLKANHVKLSLPSGQTLVRVDSTELQEVVVNLLQNSLYWLRHVAEDQRAIDVDVRRTQEGDVQVVFSDSGPGVAAEHRASIFDPYFSTKPEGVGLGLTIAGEIASDYYEGALELLDSGPLPGATFRLTLRKRV